MDRYPIAQSSFRVGGIELPNRIVRAAHATGYVRNGISEDLITYHEARAAGGVGLTFLELATVHPSSATQGYELIAAHRDDLIAQYARLSARLHAQGGKVFQQLWHGGAEGLSLDGSPSWSASEIPSVRHGPPPIAMTQAMIDELVGAFAAAARRCERGGIDGVELHAGHGYLFGQFLSLVTNRRTDDYGGTPENRLRFLVEVLVAIRGEVRPGYPLGVRFSASDLTPGGPVEADVREFALALQRRGLVDFVNLSLGTHRTPGKFIGGMHEPHGYELPYAQQITRALRVPTIVNGRIMTLAEAEEVLSSGVADLVSMVRATIADPHIVAKSFRGREVEVRPCIGCNQGCIGGIMAQRRLGCAVNAEVGREAWPPPGRRGTPQFVLVVGAGPAGLEAARTCALRGDRVMLHDSLEAPGGLTRIARLAPYRAEFGLICDYLAAECARLRVEMRYSSPVDVDTVAHLKPDTVIVATGSRFRRDGLQRWRPAAAIAGIDLPHVVTPLEVLSGGITGRRALVLDDLGTYAAVGVSEYLIERGCAVTLAASQAIVAPQLVTSCDWEPVIGRLLRKGVTILTRVVLERVSVHGAGLRHLDSGVAYDVESDLVVLCTGFQAQRALYNELTGLHPDVRLIGDARSPRGLQAAIADGYAVA